MKSNAWQSWTDVVPGLLSLRQHESELVFNFPLGSLWCSFGLLEILHSFVLVIKNLQNIVRRVS